MDDEKYQKELFEFDKPKRFFPRLSDFLPRYDFERNIAFTLAIDKAVLISIGMIMIMVAVYAVGVEDGKSRVKPAAGHRIAPAPALRPIPAPVKVQKVNTVRNTPYVIRNTKNQPKGVRNVATSKPALVR